MIKAQEVSAYREIQTDSVGKAIKSDTLQQKTGKRKRSRLYRFFQNFNAIDTAYIEPNHYNFAAMIQESNLFSFYTIEGKNEDDKKQRISLSAHPRLKIGP